MTEPPDSTLDDFAAGLSVADEDLEGQLLDQFNSTTLDGQRVVNMLELACYADVQCHPVEFPLREATLAFVREHMDAPSVREAVNWVQSSYECQLPIVGPDDPSRQFEGMLVQLMDLRMADYAKELVTSAEDSSQNK